MSRPPRGAARPKGRKKDSGTTALGPAAWLLVTNRFRWEKFRSKGWWAFHHFSMPQAKQIRPGDTGFVYLTKETDSKPSAVAAIMEFVSEGKMVRSSTFFDAMYPFRVPFVVVTEAEPAIPIQRILPRLQFIVRKDQWGIYFQGKSAIRLSAMDAGVIRHAIQAAHSQG